MRDRKRGITGCAGENRGQDAIDSWKHATAVPPPSTVVVVRPRSYLRFVCGSREQISLTVCETSAYYIQNNKWEHGMFS